MNSMAMLLRLVHGQERRAAGVHDTMGPFALVCESVASAIVTNALLETCKILGR